MTEAQMRHKEYYDGQRKPDPNLQSGDIVWLLRRNIRTTRPCKKLDYKKIGPFKILARIGTSAYKLDIPALMRMHTTHSTSLFSSLITITSFLHNNRNLFLLLSLKVNQNTNSNKSSTRVYIITSSNTKLSGQDTHQNMTKPSTLPIPSKMQTSQSGTSAPATATSRTSKKLEEQGNDDILVSVSQAPDGEAIPPQPTKTPTPQENWRTTIGLPEMTPTSAPYRSPSAWDEAERKQK